MAISLSVGLTVAAVIADSLRALLSGIIVAVSIDMVSDGSRQAAAAEPILPCLGMVYSLRDPVVAGLEASSRLCRIRPHAFLYQSGGGVHDRRAAALPATTKRPER